jgi:hypothetical protein
MVQITAGAYGRFAHLECDNCRYALEFVVRIPPEPADTIAERSALRHQAQHRGWTYLLLGLANDKHDLCPRCFTLPPEG